MTYCSFKIILIMWQHSLTKACTCLTTSDYTWEMVKWLHKCCCLSASVWMVNMFNAAVYSIKQNKNIGILYASACCRIHGYTCILKNSNWIFLFYQGNFFCMDGHWLASLRPQIGSNKCFGMRYTLQQSKWGGKDGNKKRKKRNMGVWKMRVQAVVFNRPSKEASFSHSPKW